MKATELLLNQHREVDKLFEKLEGAEDADKKALREELAQNLVAHSTIEKEIFYPAVKQAMPDLIGEAYVEHGLVEYSLSQLLSTRTNDESFKAKVTVLKEVVTHHVKEEETEMLPKIEGVLGETRDQELGAQMETRFEAIRAKGYKSLLKQALAETAPRMATRATSGSSAKKAPATTAKAASTSKRAAPAKRRAAPTRKGAMARTASTGSGTASRKTSQRSTRSAAR